MPRTGGVYSPPAGTKGVSNTTIQSVPYNAFVDDLTADANAARPITAGGTGATSASAARTALGAQTASAALTSISGLTTAADRMIYTTASDVYATTALTPFARNILDDATAGAALTTLGVSAFIQTVLDDSDAATARATLGADNASNLTAGTVPSARIAGAYTGFTQAQITSDGEALSLIGSATGDPYVAFWKAAVRQGYIQHRDDGSNIGFIWSNDIATGGATLLCLLNTGGVDGLRYRVGATNHTVWHSGNLTAADLGAAVTTTDIIAGNGLTGGGAISADRTLALGTPSNITNSTTNSVTADSHTHALGFTAAEVYTGTNATETANLPVGHVIFSAMVDRPNNNATVTIRLSGTTGYLNGGSETVLSGTWRHRGGYTASGDRFGVFQRVA